MAHFISAKSILALAASGFALTACGSGGTGLASSTASSNFGPVSGSSVNVSLSSEYNDSIQDSNVGTVAYVIGTNPVSGQVVGRTGIATGANTGAVVTGGVATYDTDYEYLVVDDVFRTDTQIGGILSGESGSMTLTADFDDATLRGSTSELSVNGTISGTSLGGSVTANYSYLGGSGSVRGTLDGQIGSNGVIGAYHGNNSDTVLVGGLVGTAN